MALVHDKNKGGLSKFSLYSLNHKNFINNKKTYLAKSDKSKKGGVDEKIIPLLDAINAPV